MEEAASNRTGNVVPVPVVTMMPLLAQVTIVSVALCPCLYCLVQGVGAGLVLLFQHVAQGVLITTKSYLLRTLILGGFFFLVLPLGKLALVKAGLLSLSPAILSRAGLHAEEEPYSSPTLETLHGFIETGLWEIYAWVRTFVDIDEFDDYLYT